MGIEIDRDTFGPDQCAAFGERLERSRGVLERFDAARLATPPVLAASGNSPTFLGRRLWREARPRKDGTRTGSSPARASPGPGSLRGKFASLEPGRPGPAALAARLGGTQNRSRRASHLASETSPAPETPTA